MRTPEQIAADLQRFEATGEATGEDFTLRGEVVPVDEPEATTADDEPEEKRLDPDELMRIYGG